MVVIVVFVVVFVFVADVGGGGGDGCDVGERGGDGGFGGGGYTVGNGSCCSGSNDKNKVVFHKANVLYFTWRCLS